jgi:hypothetical protein
VLVLGDLAAHQNETGWFTSREVAHLLEDLRLPSPQARHVVSRSGDLVAAKLLIDRGSGREHRWALTPSGQKRAVELLGEIDSAQLEAQLTQVPGAELGNVRHTTLPPTLAPARWAEGIARLLDRFPFETNVLCMSRFPEDENQDDPNDAVIKTVREALKSHGLVLHLASDRIVDEDLLGNVAAYMWACQFGIGLYEDRVGEGVNDNLLIETGAMVMAGRRCALLKDKTAPDMPTDLVGRIYKPVDFDDLGSVSDEVHLWAAEDLGLGRCPSCPG